MINRVLIGACIVCPLLLILASPKPPSAQQTAGQMAFDLVIRNGRIYARGIGDNKGQHFAQLLAIESLQAVADALPCNVIVLLEGEEESAART